MSDKEIEQALAVWGLIQRKAIKPRKRTLQWIDKALAAFMEKKANEGIREVNQGTRNQDRDYV